MEEDMSDRREQEWHVGKEVPIAVVAMFLMTILSGVIQYYVFTEKVDGFMRETAKHMEATSAQIKSNRKEMQTLLNQQDQKIALIAAERVRRETVTAMFETRDAKLDAIQKQIDSFVQGQQSQTLLLQQILQKLPR